MNQQDFFNAFYNNLRDNDFDEEFIQSIDKLIKFRKFSAEQFEELIEEAFDESK